MEKITEKIMVEIHHETLNDRRIKRTINIYGEDKNLLFSETTILNNNFLKTRSGIAGAVNLLLDMLYGNKPAYYLNDNIEILSKVSENFTRSNRYCLQNCNHVGKRFNFFRKLRLKALQLKVKLLNIFK